MFFKYKGMRGCLFGKTLLLATRRSFFIMTDKLHISMLKSFLWQFMDTRAVRFRLRL